MREVKTVPGGDEDRGRDSYTLHSGKRKRLRRGVFKDAQTVSVLFVTVFSHVRKKFSVFHLRCVLW